MHCLDLQAHFKDFYSSPNNFGTGNSDYSVGQMYIDTSADDIYIYA